MLESPSQICRQIRPDDDAWINITTHHRWNQSEHIITISSDSEKMALRNCILRILKERDQYPLRLAKAAWEALTETPTKHDTYCNGCYGRLVDGLGVTCSTCKGKGRVER